MEFHNTKLFKKLARFEKDRIFRVFVFTLILFLVTDIVSSEYMYLKPDEYECPLKNKISYVKNSIHGIKKNHDTTKVVFIGDSVFYGLKACNKQFSIPKIYQEISGNSISVYDLSLHGSKLSDEYIIMKSVINYSDIIILNINYRFLSDQNKNPIISHPELVSQLEFDEEDAILLNLKDEEELLIEEIPVFKNRENIQAFIFEDHPKKIFEEVKKSISCNYNNYSFCNNEAENNTIVSFNDLSNESKKSVIDTWTNNTYNLNSTDVNIVYLKKVALLAKTSNATLVIIVNPLNLEMNKEYNFFNETEHKENILFIKSIFNSSVVFIDYTGINISSFSYYDIDHFTNEGSKVFAEILYNDTKKYLGE